MSAMSWTSCACRRDTRIPGADAVRRAAANAFRAVAAVANALAGGGVAPLGMGVPRVAALPPEVHDGRWEAEAEAARAAVPLGFGFDSSVLQWRAIPPPLPAVRDDPGKRRFPAAFAGGVAVVTAVMGERCVRGGSGRDSGEGWTASKRTGVCGFLLVRGWHGHAGRPANLTPAMRANIGKVGEVEEAEKGKKGGRKDGETERAEEQKD